MSWNSTWFFSRHPASDGLRRARVVDESAAHLSGRDREKVPSSRSYGLRTNAVPFPH